MAAMRMYLMFFAALLATACSTLALSDAERASLATPPRDIADDVAALLPGATTFVDDTESEILQRGRPLTAFETRIAQAVGVAHPELVRVLIHNDFIEPRDPAFIALARELGIETDAEEAGRAAGHGIELKPSFVRSRRVLAHELAHVAQYERMGTAGLLRDYLTQLLTVGYDRAPIEVEARASEHLR
jgi:hypothetical protein